VSLADWLVRQGVGSSPALPACRVRFLHAMRLFFTRGSAMAEGLRDALVSRNSATTSHLKTRVPGLSCGIICRWTDRQTDRHTTTTCAALSIESRNKKRP